YDYKPNSTELIEQAWAENGAAALPMGDVEPPYDGSPYYGSSMGQQLRERSYAVFLEGGSYINYGHEDWWAFGVPALFTEGLTWQEVPQHTHTVEQSYIWSLIDAYVADPAWVADDGELLIAGEGSGDDKAAAGRSDKAAIVYLPVARSITLDTTVLGGLS